MPARNDSFSARLDADQFHRFVADKRIEHSRRVAAATDAGDDGVGQAADLLQALLARLVTDDRLKVPDDERERVRPDYAADDVVSMLDRRHPVAQGLVDGIAQ